MVSNGTVGGTLGPNSRNKSRGNSRAVGIVGSLVRTAVCLSRPLQGDGFLPRSLTLYLSLLVIDSPYLFVIILHVH